MKPKEILKKAPGLPAATNAVLLATALAKAERERIDKMQREVLNERPYAMNPEYLQEGQDHRITDPKRSYLMCDNDFAIYHEECQRRIIAMGYKVPKDHCPALIAERLQMEAEHALIEAAGPLTGLDDPMLLLQQKDGLEKYKKYVDLILKMMLALPGYVPPQIPKA